MPGGVAQSITAAVRAMESAWLRPRSRPRGRSCRRSRRASRRATSCRHVTAGDRPRRSGDGGRKTGDGAAHDERCIGLGEHDAATHGRPSSLSAGIDASFRGGARPIERRPAHDKTGVAAMTASGANEPHHRWPGSRRSSPATRAMKSSSRAAARPIASPADPDVIVSAPIRRTLPGDLRQRETRMTARQRRCAPVAQTMTDANGNYSRRSGRQREPWLAGRVGRVRIRPEVVIEGDVLLEDHHQVPDRRDGVSVAGRASANRPAVMVAVGGLPAATLAAASAARRPITNTQAALRIVPL